MWVRSSLTHTVPVKQSRIYTYCVGDRVCHVRHDVTKTVNERMSFLSDHVTPVYRPQKKICNQKTLCVSSYVLLQETQEQSRDLRKPFSISEIDCYRCCLVETGNNKLLTRSWKKCCLKSLRIFVFTGTRKGFVCSCSSEDPRQETR